MAEFIVAVTGGIASGKSAVTQLFFERGIDVADADVAARKVVEVGQPALEEIVGYFGPQVLANGQLNRQALREIVFVNADARKQLESITHPRIRDLLMEECKAAASPYAIVEIPLLAESNKTHYRWLDRILVVDVSREIQKTRLLVRDKISDALAEKMLGAQTSRSQRLAIADDIISNTHDMDTLKRSVERLDSRYRKLAKSKQARSC